MDTSEKSGWEQLTRAEKNRRLYAAQKRTLGLLLERHAITQAQYDKSLRDLTEKMDI
jgi:hypothetical protein